MHIRITLLLFLMSGSLIAMNSGIWDEHGNYLGPEIPSSLMFIPVPVSVVRFVPVFVPMPVIFPIDLDRVPAIAENNLSIHEDADGIADQYDDEVTSITSRMEEIQTPFHSSANATPTHASRRWSDEADDSAPITLPPEWKMYAIPTDQNPPNELHQAVVPLSDSAQKDEVEAPSASTECAIQVKKKRHTRSVASPQQLHAQEEDSLDERLNVAMHAPKNMHSLLRLLKTKVHWLAKECSLGRRARECIQLAQQIKINLDAVRPVSQHAVAFLGYADTCIHKMQKEKTYESKRGFACLARELIAIAQKGTLGHDQKLRIQNQLSSIPDDSIIADVDIFINK